MNRLKELRTQKKITQQELANVIGVSKRTIIEWEKSKELSLKLDKAQKLADYFGVPMTYLLGHSANPDGVREGIQKLTELDKLLNEYQEELNEPMDLELYNEIISQQPVSFGRMAFSMISSKIISKIENRIFQKAMEEFEKEYSEIIEPKDWYFLMNSDAFEKIQKFYSAIGNLPPDEANLIVYFSTLEEDDRKAILLTIKSLSEKTCYIIDHTTK